MNLLKNEIERRNLPDLFTFEDGTPVVTREDWEKRRKEIRAILCREIYGQVPPVPDDVRMIPEKATGDPACAGKIREDAFRVAFTTPNGEWSLPVRLFIPKNPIGGRKPPLLLHLNFRPLVPDKYYPLEEITDSGFATAQVYYQDITTDDRDFTNGIAGMYPGNHGAKDQNELRDPEAWGKLQMWAFACSRVLDVLLKRDDIDTEKIVIAGHSRLGKTALLAAAMDERFAGACSNDSGCSGAAITRDKTGERVDEIWSRFPNWFCPNYQKYVKNEYAMPFDQHFLTALIAPRLVCIGSAWEDSWADPFCEFMNAALTSRVQTFLDTGKVPSLDEITSCGGVKADRYPGKGEAFVFSDRRTTHYHLRPGAHYFSREDWNQYIAFLSGVFYR